VHPLANASAATAQPIRINVTINGDIATLDTPEEVIHERNRDQRDNLVEHGALSSYQSS
jgi:hypothetical protein